MIPAYAKVVTPSEVSSELEKLRRHGASDTNEEERNVVRATLANVVFLLGEDGVEELIHQLGRNLPSRFFSVGINPTLTSDVRISVASIPVENSSGQILQTEEIYIEVRPEAVNRVPNLLLSHLVPDIDVVVVESPKFRIHSKSEELRELTLRIANIYVAEDASGVAESYITKHPDCSYRSWSLPLISKWCAIISEQFDSDYVLSSLKDLTEVSLDFEVGNSELISSIDETSQLDAYLPADVWALITWLNKRLNLKIESILGSKNGSLELQLVPLTDAYLSNPIKLILKAEKSQDEMIKTHILKTVFLMGEPERHYEVNCSYLAKSHTVEISCGGTINISNANSNTASESNLKPEFCDFNVRRIPAKSVTQADAILIAIRNQPINCGI